MPVFFVRHLSTTRVNSRAEKEETHIPKIICSQLRGQRAAASVVGPAAAAEAAQPGKAAGRQSSNRPAEARHSQAAAAAARVGD